MAKSAVRGKFIAGAICALAVGGCGGEDKADTPPAKTSEKTEIIGTINLSPPNATGTETGTASVAEKDTQLKLVIQARVDPSASDEAYEVWLYNSSNDARSLGAQTATRGGLLRGVAPLPAKFGARYRYIDISVEKVDKNKRHSGRSVLRGQIGPELP